MSDTQSTHDSLYLDRYSRSVRYTQSTHDSLYSDRYSGSVRYTVYSWFSVFRQVQWKYQIHSLLMILCIQTGKVEVLDTQSTHDSLYSDRYSGSVRYTVYS